nr:MAG TPA: hypothetical protein [Caudoviricetes sp.]
MYCIIFCIYLFTKDVPSVIMYYINYNVVYYI